MVGSVHMATPGLVLKSTCRLRFGLRFRFRFGLGGGMGGSLLVATTHSVQFKVNFNLT